MLSQQILLRTSRLRFKIRKESLQISKDSSSPESNSKTAELSPITTSKRSQPFISSSDLEVECKSLSRPSLERPSLLMSSQQILLRTSKQRSKTRKESHQISKDLSLPESNLKTAELSLITTSRRSQPFISSSDLEVVCKSSSRPSLERPSPLTSSQQTPSKTSKQRSKIRKESHQISKDSFSLENNLKMAELFQTTTSKKNPLFILSLDSEEESEILFIKKAL